jgi:aminodeoxyfutalosine synthase
MAGSEEQTPSMSTEDLCDLISAVGKLPVERDTLYNEVKTYEAVV